MHGHVDISSHFMLICFLFFFNFAPHIRHMSMYYLEKKKTQPKKERVMKRFTKKNASQFRCKKETMNRVLANNKTAKHIYIKKEMEMETKKK